jgi:hypothetical protein
MPKNASLTMMRSSAPGLSDAEAEAISRLLERHGDKRLSIKAGLVGVSANPAVLQHLCRATLLQGQRTSTDFTGR